jgi:signal transduction histidine kinase
VSVRVAVFSKDETLVRFCREILSELFGAASAVVTGIPGCVISSADVCIWDFTPGETAIPQDLEPAELCNHWFVLNRKDLPALQAVVGASDLKVLLKPVTWVALRAFLAGAHGLGKEPNDDSTGRVEAVRVERDEMLQFLMQANLKLQEFEQERNNFLARSLHDFRAPLTAISGYCGLLLEEELGPLAPEQQKVLERMRQSANRLSRISNGMFQLTVPHNVQPRLNMEQADIRDCFDQALHEVALAVEDKRITIAADIEPPPDRLLFAKSPMEQTLVNLLDNACKFTPRDGMIEVRGYPFFWERRTGQAPWVDRTLERRVRQGAVMNSFRIDIRDSGPGIPAARADRIFEEYTSYGGGQDRSGGGLGLAICRMILHRHQGRIWAESSPSGAVFSLVLPMQPAGASQWEAENHAAAACLAGKGGN